MTPSLTSVSFKYYEAALHVLRMLGASKVTHHHWTEWHLNGKVVAKCVSSPYPGPEYGTFCYVDNTAVSGYISYITRSRPINGTEQHLLNQALRDEYDSNMLPSWVKPLYDDAKADGLKEVYGTIRWNEEYRL